MDSQVPTSFKVQILSIWTWTYDFHVDSRVPFPALEAIQEVLKKPRACFKDCQIFIPCLPIQ